MCLLMTLDSNFEMSSAESESKQDEDICRSHSLVTLIVNEIDKTTRISHCFESTI